MFLLDVVLAVIGFQIMAGQHILIPTIQVNFEGNFRLSMLAQTR